MAQIIFLHGASSSGKSTIAKALQARIEKPFWHISIDHLSDAGVLPTERMASILSPTNLQRAILRRSSNPI
jgi:chloramphenicol 3-O-phosphotransferase